MSKRYLLVLISSLFIFTMFAREHSERYNGYFIHIPRVPVVELADSNTYFPDYYVVHPSIMYMPIIFQKQQIINDSIVKPKFNVHSAKTTKLDVDDSWLTESMRKAKFENYHMNRIIYQNPAMVKYNISMLPEPPKTYVIVEKPNKLTLSLEELIQKTKPTEKPESAGIKYKSWINRFDASLQFSQAYLSQNWYQGGNSNLNLYANVVYNVKLNQNVHPNLLFENSIQYKLSLSSAPQDTLRSYSISEDLFQINTKFGVKAFKKWFYTTTLMFKTQLLNNYTVNTHNMKASFLTPGELNFGFGMTYSSVNKRKTFNVNLSIAPLSYNMKICRDINRVDPTVYGIEAGKHIKSQYGSNLEGKLSWIITPNISLNSRLFVFTDYTYIQGDLENTFNFSINKYLSTQLYFHLRYDTSASSDPDWKKWQFKEILSFGLNFHI